MVLTLIKELALKLNNPAEVKRITTRASADLAFHRRVPWIDLSLASGYPGLLLLFANLEQAEIFQEGIAHKYVLAIHEQLERQTLNDLSLHSGVSGICFALQAASHGGTRYQGMLQALNDLLLKQVAPVYLEPLRAHRKCQESSPSYLHDLIQGLSGVGRYLLENLSLFGELVEQTIKDLVVFSEPFLCQGKKVPGWHLSANDLLNVRSKNWPNGNFNLGLAHGIPGVLAFLSIAWLKGVSVEGQKETMVRIAEWIQQKSIITQRGIRWPSCVSWEEESSSKPARDAWCYGVPGVSRALYLCGKALRNEALSLFAIEAFRGIFQRTREEWDLPGPMLCHGIAGLLLMTQAMATSPEGQDLLPQVEKLRQLVLDLYEPNAPFGYQDLHLSNEGTFLKVDNAGLLEGSAGVLLTLLNSQSSWHLPFLVTI